MILSSVAEKLGTAREQIIAATSKARVFFTGAMRGVGHQAEKTALVAREAFRIVGRYVVDAAAYARSGAATALSRVKAHPPTEKPKTLSD